MKNRNGRPSRPEALGGLLDGNAWGGLGTDGQRQLGWGQLLRRRWYRFCQRVDRRAGAVEDTGNAGAYFGEQVELVVEQVQYTTAGG